jgi:diguanylate cyclase (GGDEF)-like protein/PAS domain S-box-containing protein
MLKDLSIETVLNNLTMGIAILDEKRNFTYINDLTTKITGYSLDDINNLDQWFKNAYPNSEKREKVRSIFEDNLKKSKYYNKVLKIKTKTGKEKHIEFRVNSIGNNYLLVNLMDVSQRVARKNEIEYLSFHDELTSLYNRRYFENEMERLDESRKYPISIIIGDLDNLKDVNDNFGHLVGDDYLKRSALILEKLMRSEDIIARIGGDEFAILLPGTGKAETSLICERIKERFSEINSRGNFPVDFKISLGCATAADNQEQLVSVYNSADQNMYKNKGRKQKRSGKHIIA